MISKRRRRRLRGKLRAAWRAGIASGLAEPWDSDEFKAAARKRLAREDDYGAKLLRCEGAVPKDVNLEF